VKIRRDKKKEKEEDENLGVANERSGRGG